jgi:hypothetical protein
MDEHQEDQPNSKAELQYPQDDGDDSHGPYFNRSSASE